MTRKGNKNRGSSLDDLLEDEGVLQEFQAVAIKETIAHQLAQEMERQQLTKAAMAEKMETSRAQLNRLLDPVAENVTLDTLQRAAKVLGKKIRLDLI